jgi:hypothetical protein
MAHLVLGSNRYEEMEGFITVPSISRRANDRLGGWGKFLLHPGFERVEFLLNVGGAF